MSETVKAPRYLASFGPVNDNVVVPKNLLEEMEKPDSSFQKYDLLFGLVNNEGKKSIWANDGWLQQKKGICLS